MSRDSEDRKSAAKPKKKKVMVRKPKSDAKPEKLQPRSQVDVIRKAAGNIEKSSRPKSERHLPASGKVGTGINYEEAPYGGKHKQAFIRAALRDQLRRGDIDFGREKGQHLGAPMKSKSEMAALGEHAVNVRTAMKRKTRETRKGDESRARDEFLSMGRQDTKDDESLSVKYDRTKIDDILGEFKTGTGKKPKDKRRRKIKVYTTDPNSGLY